MANYKVGKGANYERYVLLTLRTMYEADVVYFTVAEVCSWGGIPVNGAVRHVLDQMVKRGWLSIEPRELRRNSHATTYYMGSAVWFGAGTGKHG